jgi:hypothetical protein
MERTAFCGFRFYPNGTAMQLHYFLAVRQPNARAFIHRPVMQPLKNDEYAFLVLFFNANAVIAEPEMPVTVFAYGRDLYTRRYARLLEFDGIADQVLK